MTNNADHLFTTGQVVGMLGISLSSLQLYIREYRDYLSDTASQQKQGRRYTGKDIECLMTIRNLRFTRADKATIEAALQGDTSTTPVYKVSDMASLLAGMEETEKRIRQQAKRAADDLKQIEITRQNVDFVMKKIRASQDDSAGDFESLSLRIVSLQDEVNALTRKIERLEYNRPFSIWEWITDKLGV